MKSLVVYHSITGNTKKIAEAIQRGIIATGEQCDIARIKNIKTSDLAKYDLIGLGSPVMRQRELLNVTSFLDNILKGVDGKYGFAFCTHGANPGIYLARVVPRMEQRGLTVVGWNDWFGNCFYPAIPKPYFTDGHPDEIDIKEAEDFGREMAERSERIRKGETQLIPQMLRGKAYDDYYDPDPPPSAEIMAAFGRARARSIQLKVNPDKCKYPKCTLCIDNCPMGSIDFSVKPPLFNINCDLCYSCEQACPNGAIEVDWMPFHEAHLPMIEHLRKSLEIFEARGRFRRLVPLDQVGKDGYVWQHRHPRIKFV